MSTSIAFTDGTGSATLTNGKTGFGGRFRNWVPLPEPEASSVVGLGTGAVHEWRFRADHGASFELHYIPAASLDIASRLKLHLEGGGSCTVTTGDSSSNVYTCTLFPGSKVALTQQDPALMEYALSLKLRNSGNAVMRCLY